MQTCLLALRGMVVVLVLAIVLGGHRGGDVGYQSMPVHDSQSVRSETGGAYLADIAAGHCDSSVSCQFVSPAEFAVLPPVASGEPPSLAALGLIGSPQPNPLFRPPRQA